MPSIQAMGVGVEISPEMIEVAKAAHPRFTYYEAFPEDFVPQEKFDYICSAT